MTPILARLFRPTLAAAFLLCASAAGAQQATKFHTVPLNIGIHVIQAEAAITPAQRELGLMHREKMGPNEGMVFLFESPTTICMWMKNTLLPHSQESHCGAKPVKYALEMNQGWFRQKNIKPGTLVDGLPR